MARRGITLHIVKTVWGIEKGGSRGYRTTRSVQWPIGKKGSQHIEIIPSGFEFESSVPSWLTRVFPPDDPHYLLSACVHDWLLEAGFDTDFADSQWLAAARKSRAPRTKTRLVRMLMLLRRMFKGQWKDL